MNKTSTFDKSDMASRKLVTAALMAAVICIVAPFSIPIPISPVPITFANLIIFISAYILGAKYAAVSCCVYLLIGFVGLPVFSGFTGGVGKLAGPTGGYLVGFVFLALITGIFIERFPQKRIWHTFGMVLGSLVTYIFGTLWLSFQLDLTFIQGLSAGVLPYIPGDLIKIIIALIAGPLLQKRLRRFLV